MKEIIALKEYTDKYISLYEGEIRNIEDNLADRLISKEVVAEHNDNDNGNNSIFIIKLAQKTNPYNPNFQVSNAQQLYNYLTKDNYQDREFFITLQQRINVNDYRYYHLDSVYDSNFGQPQTIERGFYLYFTAFSFDDSTKINFTRFTINCAKMVDGSIMAAGTIQSIPISTTTT